MAEPILRVEDLSKSFGPTRANIGVNFTVYPGEIRALAGENGSGKSTLLSQIAGIYPPDSGSMWVGGEPYAPQSPQEANAHGVSMIVQELGVIGTLPADINVFLGRLDRFTKGGIVRRGRLNAAIDEVIREWDLPDIPRRPMCDGMSVEERKMIELVRALSNEPRVLILDEVTQALSLNNRKILYQVIARLKEMGRSVIFISHDLEEVMEIADSITVLRDGEVVDTVRTADINLDRLKRMMIGREVEGQYYREDDAPSYDENDVVLKVEDLEVPGELENFSFDVHAGEILGFCGLSDSGIHTVGKALYGLCEECDYRKTKVTLTKTGAVIRDPQIGLRNGVAYLPKDRDGEGLMMKSSIRDNMVLPSTEELEGALGFLAPKALDDTAYRTEKTFEVKCTSIFQPMSGLSGGNKQKVNLGRWLGKDLNLLIVDCPTRGVDVGVKAYIYQTMLKAKEDGLAIVLISDELTEVLGMADRIFVVKTGKVVREIMRGPDFSEETVIEVMV